LKIISESRFADMAVYRFGRYVADQVFRAAVDTEFYFVSSAWAYTWNLAPSSSTINKYQKSIKYISNK